MLALVLLAIALGKRYLLQCQTDLMLPKALDILGQLCLLVAQIVWRCGQLLLSLSRSNLEVSQVTLLLLQGVSNSQTPVPRLWTLFPGFGPRLQFLVPVSGYSTQSLAAKDSNVYQRNIIVGGGPHGLMDAASQLQITESKQTDNEQ